MSSQKASPGNLVGDNVVDSIRGHSDQEQTISLSFADENVSSKYYVLAVIESIVSGADVALTIEVIGANRNCQEYPEPVSNQRYSGIFYQLLRLVVLWLGFGLAGSTAFPKNERKCP